MNLTGWTVRRGRTLLVGLALSSALYGCSTTDVYSDESVAFDEDAVTDPAPTAARDSDHGNAELAVTWQNVTAGAVLDASKSLVAELTNRTTYTLAGELVLVSSGLDGQLIERSLGAFRLPADARQQVQIPVGSLTIQSEESTAFTTVHAKLQRPDGSVIGVPASPPLLSLPKWVP